MRHSARSRPPRRLGSSKLGGLILSALGLVTAVLSPREAAAYCRTSSCPDKTIGTVCTPSRTGDCGVPIFWPTPCTGFTVQRDGTPGIDAKTTEDLAARAFASWTNADCGGGAHPKMRVDDLGLVSCGEPEYNQTLANSNTIMFRSNGWPYPANNTIALTTVTFNLDTGEIRDADMELNSTDILFSTDDTAITYDLLSILTHETGHFLGLGHSPVAGATMQPDYPPKSLVLRTLEQDDIDAICDVYPPGTVPDTCDSTPRNGLGDACKSPAGGTTSSCCAVAPTGAEGNGDGAAATVVALVGLAGARIRKRARGVG